MFALVFWPSCVACGILVPQPGLKSKTSVLEAQSPNHWASRRFLLGAVVEAACHRSAIFLLHYRSLIVLAFFCLGLDSFGVDFWHWTTSFIIIFT